MTFVALPAWANWPLSIKRAILWQHYSLLAVILKVCFHEISFMKSKLLEKCTSFCVFNFLFSSAKAYLNNSRHKHFSQQFYSKICCIISNVYDWRLSYIQWSLMQIRCLLNIVICPSSFCVHVSQVKIYIGFYCMHRPTNTNCS